MEHLCHGSPLMLMEKAIDDKVLCQGCGKTVSGQSYGCSEHEFYLHKSCAELPLEIDSVFHKSRLTLRKDYTKDTERRSICSGCKKYIPGFRYRCDPCDFNLDTECAFLQDKASCCDEQNEGSDNYHPLPILEKEENEKLSCKVCEKFCSGPTFSCDRCGYHVHKACMDNVMKEVMNFRHPCPLLLQKLPPYRCGICDQIRSGVVFRCEKCDLNMDVECVLRHKMIDHFSHGHPLTLCHMKDYDDACCRACGKKCSGATYSCNRCSFCLHKSCGELRREIQHELHKHPLTLLDKSFQCDACFVHSSGFTYNCSLCDFDLHVECTSLAPSIKYEGHDEHLLTFVSHVYGKPPCHVCDSKFSGDSKYSNDSTYCGDSYLRCVECDFNVHLMCVPLPCVIEHPCHTDPLVLKDCHIDDVSEGQVYICDVLDCEMERDPRECVYFCEECDFVAQLGCVLGQVLSLLEGKHGEVETRKVNRDVAVKLLERKFISFNDILNSFDQNDEREMNRVRSSFLEECDKIFNKAPEDHLSNYTDNVLKYQSYSDEAFFMFTATIEPDLPLGFEMKKMDTELEIVSVGDLRITKELAPVLKKLIDKYGDFTAESYLTSSNVKTHHLVTFCRVIHNMCNTKVMEISANLLREWWIRCKLAQHAGFKIQFAFESMNKVAYVRFALVSEIHAGTILDQIDDEITKLCSQIEDLTEQLKGLKKKRIQHISCTRFAQSSLREGFLSQALELRLNMAIADL